MAFAPHSNDHVQAQLRAGLIPTPLPLILGEFRNAETDVFFNYAERRHPDDSFAPEACHVIYVKDGTRLAIVKKTVAHIVVDEHADGTPIWVKWPLKQHRHYPTDWVRP